MKEIETVIVIAKKRFLSIGRIRRDQKGRKRIVCRECLKTSRKVTDPRRKGEKGWGSGRQTEGC